MVNNVDFSCSQLVPLVLMAQAVRAPAPVCTTVSVHLTPAPALVCPAIMGHRVSLCVIWVGTVVDVNSSVNVRMRLGAGRQTVSARVSQDTWEHSAGKVSEHLK